MALDALLREVLTSQEKIASALAAMNEQPHITPGTVVMEGIADQGKSAEQVPSRYLSMTDRLTLRQELRKRSDSELAALFSMQARSRDAGVPVEEWLRAGGATASYVMDGIIRQQSDPMVRKALDSGGASALIRQDLEPVLYEIYVREFPAWERFPKEPANGLVHAFNQITAFGAAEFMAELGTVADDKSTYVRQTTNVAIVATRRGISLKSEFAVAAGGMGYDPMALELRGGSRALAKKEQDTIFGGSIDSAGTATNETGLYDANGYTGLRSTLNQAQAVNADPTVGLTGSPTTPDDLRSKIDAAAVAVMNNGGKVGIVWANPLDKTTFDLQQDKNVRYMDRFVDVAPGVVTNAVNTVFGPLPIAMVPGSSIGAYVPDVLPSNWNTARDLYLLDESVISMPYLGSDGPTVLEIPIGISGQLTRLYIIFGMWGLAVKAPTFCNKVRVRVS
jgi:hypothetical protein